MFIFYPISHNHYWQPGAPNFEIHFRNPLPDKFKAMKKTAILSNCEKYRYSLTREWDATLPKVLFVMLNPSTADAKDDDPTIRRCIGFAKAWGYGGIMVGNLFAYRATNPKELKKVQVFNNEINDNHLVNMAYDCQIVIEAYGNPPIRVPDYPLRAMPHLFHLGLTKKGNPKHPLYLPKDLKPIPYSYTPILNESD